MSQTLVDRTGLFSKQEILQQKKVLTETRQYLRNKSGKLHFIIVLPWPAIYVTLLYQSISEVVNIDKIASP